MMKVLFSSVIVLIFAGSAMSLMKKEDLGPKLLELVDTLHKECVHKTGVDEKTIEGVGSGTFVEDIKIKKYIECLWIEAAVVDEAGLINMDMISELSPPQLKDLYLRLITYCYSKNEGISPLYEKIYKIAKCIYEKDPEHFIMF
ncbi:hypothetical protein JTB14_005724 [Gonioctena quinquepunctata]|nr:hypothetical protein JTB14_005724 [Gonioctena quinquepunctata]